jgi:superoxide reductase
MPRLMKVTDIDSNEKEARRDYFDRHTPFIECVDEVKKGDKFKVKVRLGKEYSHPDNPDHFINQIQLWNRETFLAEVHFAPGVLANQKGQIEVDFYLVMRDVSMNLSAMAVCTNHGLWQSAEVAVKAI